LATARMKARPLGVPIPVTLSQPVPVVRDESVPKVRLKKARRDQSPGTHCRTCGCSRGVRRAGRPSSRWSPLCWRRCRLRWWGSCRAARHRPDEEILQQLVAKLPWSHDVRVLDRIKEPSHARAREGIGGNDPHGAHFTRSNLSLEAAGSNEEHERN
jgi:hypothetical protein